MAQLCAGTCRATLAWLVDKGAGYTSGSSLHIHIYIYIYVPYAYILLASASSSSVPFPFCRSSPFLRKKELI